MRNERIIIIDTLKNLIEKGIKYPSYEPVSWAKKDSPHQVQILTIRDQAEMAISLVKRTFPDLFKDEKKYGNGNGQKLTEGDRWIPNPLGTKQAGIFVDESGQPYVVKHPNWWREEDRKEAKKNPGQIPDYAMYPIAVVKRPINEERQAVEAPTQPEAVGSELEFAAVKFHKEGIHLVNIQSVIEHLKTAGVPVSREGWSSQIEHPSNPRDPNLGITDHKRDLVKDLLAISETLAQFGVYLLPVSTIPGYPYGQPNFGDPHVRNVLTQGMRAALKRELTVEEAAEILMKYGVNGLHTTVNLKKDNLGFVGDERLRRVFELTHTPITAILKALTLSGNLGSLKELESDRLSYRDVKRTTFPTARVGVVRNLHDEEAIEALKEGLSPSIERASLCDEGGEQAAGAHNPLGRQKETGRNEFTVFDIEANVDKILALESLMSLWTTIVDKAILEGRLDDLLGGLGVVYRRIFTEFLESEEVFKQISEVIEQQGIFAKLAIELEDGTKVEFTAGNLIQEFISWVREKSIQFGVANEGSEEILKIDWLSHKLQQHQNGEVPDNFEDYLNPNSYYYAVGTIAEIAKRRFEQLTKSGITPEQAYFQILEELAEAYRKHLLNLWESLRYN